MPPRSPLAVAGLLSTAVALLLVYPGAVSAKSAAANRWVLACSGKRANGGRGFPRPRGAAPARARARAGAWDASGGRREPGTAARPPVDRGRPPRARRTAPPRSPTTLPRPPPAPAPTVPPAAAPAPQSPPRATQSSRTARSTARPT
jgi:hypothetical protein